MNQTNARLFVQIRSAGDRYLPRRCEIRLPDICTGRATDWHHRKNRSQGGLWTPSNGLDLCHACHMHITDTREEYFRMGWLVSREDEPAEVPAVIYSMQYEYGERVALLLDDEGCVTLAPFPEGLSGDPFALPVVDEWGAA